MPEYKLTYFNLRAKGELIRLLFAAADVQYEDHRVDHDEWPGEIKREINPPFGQLPILSVAGEVFCQSNSICRYIAEKYGLAGRTELEKLRCDMIVHCAEDVNYNIGFIRRTKDQQIKKQLQETFVLDKLDVYLRYFEQMLSQNSNGAEFFVSQEITWADLAVFHCLTSHLPAAGFPTPSFIDRFPLLKSLVQRVETSPRISAWIAKRPETEF